MEVDDQWKKSSRSEYGGQRVQGEVHIKYISVFGEDSTGCKNR
jgi:hypothetical protein